MWTVDLVLRFVFVIAAPIALVPLAVVVPMGGVLVGVGAATAIALAGSDRWRARTATIPVAGGFLSKLAGLGDYYREHPPKPLIYYIAYPLLAPYWLFVRDARREFLLYRRINAIAFLVMVGAGAYDYIKNWRPEIPFGAFFTSSIASLFLQLLVTMCLVMPIVTTIVRYHTSGHRRALAIMLGISVLLATAMTIFAMRSDRASPSAQIRLRWRAAHDPARTTATLQDAVAAAQAAPDDTTARTAARGALAAVWRPDEVRAFNVRRADNITLVHAYLGRRRPPLWLARRADGRYITLRDELPAELRERLTRR
ncbi:MAG: hypothetical protein H0T89_23765 [Deltaproteobacteria bacterium]|nr:hypothetical protein [Deltaproteobacteria bacterium]MDQ3300322.1 hypothetical protein [Myxococcota bacterium]